MELWQPYCILFHLTEDAPNVYPPFVIVTNYLLSNSGRNCGLILFSPIAEMYDDIMYCSTKVFCSPQLWQTKYSSSSELLYCRTLTLQASVLNICSSLSADDRALDEVKLLVDVLLDTQIIIVKLIRWFVYSNTFHSLNTNLNIFQAGIQMSAKRIFFCFQFRY